MSAATQYAGQQSALDDRVRWLTKRHAQLTADLEQTTAELDEAKAAADAHRATA